MAVLLLILVCLPFLAGIIAYALGVGNPRARDIFSPFAALAELGLAIYLCTLVWSGAEISWSAAICGMGLRLQADGFRVLWGAAAAFSWACSSAIAPEYLAHGGHQGRYQLFTFITLGGVIPFTK